MLYTLVTLNAILVFLLFYQERKFSGSFRKSMELPFSQVEEGRDRFVPTQRQESRPALRAVHVSSLPERARTHLIPLLDGEDLGWDDTHLVCNTLLELNISEAAGSIFAALKRLDDSLMRTAYLALGPPGDPEAFEFLPAVVGSVNFNGPAEGAAPKEEPPRSGDARGDIGRTWDVKPEPLVNRSPFEEPEKSIPAEPALDEFVRILHTGTAKEAGAAAVRMAKAFPGDTRVAQMLVNCFEDAAEPYFTACLLDAMRLSGTSGTGFGLFSKQMISGLSSRSAEVRYAAVKACAASENSELIARAASLSADSAPFVSTAARGLLPLGGLRKSANGSSRGWWR